MKLIRIFQTTLAAAMVMAVILTGCGNNASSGTDETAEDAIIPSFVKNLVDTPFWYPDTICVADGKPFYWVDDIHCRTNIIFDDKEILLENPTLYYDSVSPKEDYRFNIHMADKMMTVDFNDPKSVKAMQQLDILPPNFCRFREDTLTGYGDKVLFSLCIDFMRPDQKHAGAVNTWMAQMTEQMAKADVVQLEAQLSSAQYDIVNSKAQLENYKRQLKSVLELDINSDFDIKGDIPSDEKVLAVIPNKLDAYNMALTSRPEIKSAELGIESAKMQVDIAKRAHYPTVRANASLGSNHYSGSPNNWGDQMKNNLNMGAGITLSVPIFDNRQIASNIRNAKLQQLNSQLDLQDKKTSLSSTIEQYWINANNNQQSYLAAKARVKSQEASYELLNEQFMNGLKNTVDVLQGRDNVINAEQSMLQSKYNTLLNMQLLKFYQCLLMIL